MTERRRGQDRRDDYDIVVGPAGWGEIVGRDILKSVYRSKPVFAVFAFCGPNSAGWTIRARTTVRKWTQEVE